MSLPKIDFGHHFYKFVASMGAALITAGIAVPWFFGQSVAVLMISDADLDSLNPVARHIIIQRQNTIAWIQQFALPTFTVILLTVGLIFFIWGFAGWRRRQAVLDKSEDLEFLQRDFDYNQKLAVLEDADMEEVEDKLEDEANAAQDSSESPEDSRGRGADAGRDMYRQRIDIIRNIESTLIAKVAGGFVPPFVARSNVRRKNFDASSMIFDLVLNPEPGAEWGQLAIEWKYVGRADSVTRVLPGTMMQMSVATSDFKSGAVFSGANQPKAHAMTNAVIILILEDNIASLGQTLRRIESIVTAGNHALGRPVGVLTTSVGRLMAMTPDELRNAVAITWGDPNIVHHECAENGV